MIKILIVDDQEIVRTGLRLILQNFEEITSITEASTGEEAIQLSRTLDLDVVILDISLPGLSAFESTRRLKRVRPKTAIIILAVHAKSPYPTRLLEAGASGYLTRDCNSGELLEAVKTVAQGERYIGAEAAKQLALSILPGMKESPFDELSARELEVMLKLTEGSRIPDIASLICQP